MTDAVPPFPGLTHAGPIRANLPAAALVEAAVRRNEGVLTAVGALACRTGKRTGRSPKDKYVADTPAAAEVHWGAVNQKIGADRFARIADLATAYLQNRELFTFDGRAGADPAHEIRLRVVSESAWHTLFARCLFLRADGAPGFAPDWTILHAPGLHLDRVRDGTNSEAFVGLDFDRKLIVIAGTEYAGEIKKSIFTVMNFLLPRQGVFPMHCSANIGPADDVALFFGLSGTGKTTLSADP
ncbi:MAG: phosphoenolpyruvate carboxykinase (ATP), partial [Fimbriiglobus sp.]